MKNKDYLILSIQIILIFSVLILASIIPDLWPEFFGDWKCQGNDWTNPLNEHPNCHYINSQHNPTTHWGWRHWLFSMMGLSLFVLQIFRIGNFIIKNPILKA